MNNIGQRIKSKREEKGWTQEELAKKMGYRSKSTINKIEMGINDISQGKIVKFAEVLETSIAYLMGWDQEQIDAISKIQEDADAYDDAIEAKIKQIADLNLSEAELEEVYNFAKYVISKRKEG